MKKSDLKTGMWIETRNGQKWIVLLGTDDGDVVVHEDENDGFKGGFNPLEIYEEDLLSRRQREFDIIKVFQPNPAWYLINSFTTCIFDRSKQRDVINVKINAEIENLGELKKQVEDLEESLKNLKIKLTI